MALLWRIGGQLVRAPPSFRRRATLLHRSLPHQHSWPLCCATRTCATSSSAEASEAIAPEAVVILESSSMEYRTSHGFAHEDGGYDATTHQHHSNFAEHNRESVAYVFEVITTDARTTESATHRSSSSNTDQLHEARDGDTTRGTTTTTTTTTTQCRSFHLFEEVSTLDTYARSRITNLVRGMPGGGANTSLFVVKEEELPDGRTVYWASCRLMLPQPHGLHVAEGVAENAKDAELLAAMHAERVCDALGVPLFKLPSRQRKHAETARRQGRYAPMPEDGLQPAGTRVPVPLRMFSTCRAEDDGVRGEAVRGATSAHEEVPLTHNVQSAPLFRVRVAEAEVVSRQRRPKSSATMDEDGATPHETSSSSTRATPAEDEPEWLRRYTEEVVHPWLESRYARRRSSSSPAGVAAGTTNSNSNTKAGSPVFDQTENGMWAMVNVLSARCSPTPEDALVLPYVYEPAARERMKDYFWQRGMELKDRERLTHVAVPGFSTRMYLCELRLAESTVVARGKGQTEEMARNLAAMHAELLVDALGQDLFPRDAARQARHAEAVERYGRWASHPHLPATPPSSTLPLPLKQQAGLDETWMEASGRAARLSDGERIIALHNDLYQRYGDCLEVNPPTELLHEAYTALEEWQRRVAKNTCCGLYVITKMGDFFRATTLTPVPARYGIRGGNAIGRSMEQAVHLCALHAVDMLCLLGIPIFVEPERQASFLARRRALGLSVAAASTTSTDATHHHASLYLPGYIVEGAQQRLPPHASDTMAILKLRTSEDFVVFGSGLQEERLVELGNEAKMCVQHYLRVCGEEHRKQDGNQPKQDVDDGGRLARRPMPDSINPNVYITGYGKKVSVNNIAYLRIPLPPPGMVQNTTNNTLPQPSDEDFRLAVGISLKKKDAERACFLHAVELIHGMGVDVLQHYRSGLPRSVPATPYQVVADNVEERGSQKPFMHAQMMAFLRSGKFMSPPKRRGPPSPYNPFGP